MSDATPEVEKLSMANTKKEMLQAYNRLLKKFTEKRRAEMKPADEVAAKKKTEAKTVADSLSTEGIGRQIGLLKSEIGGTLNELADRLEAETAKYTQVKKAVEDAEAELREIFDIEKAASSLAALLEAQKQKREEFNEEMATTQEDFDDEMKAQREAWEKEKAQYEAAVNEQKAAEEKQRQREQEEFKYEFDRRKQLALEQYEHEKATREREMQVKREAMEKDLAERENAVAAAEAELSQLRAKVEEHPVALEQAVARAVKETTERLERERQSQTALLEKEFTGERNVLNSRIESLQATVEQQAEQIAKLSQQLEHSYRQVQDIAVKAIEGPSASRSAGRVYPPGAHDLPPQSPQGE
jgi:DNA repair exonuclease SbcCD ATPase subunit